MSKLGSLYIKLGSPEGELSGGCCEIDDWAADEIERLRRVTYQWDQVFGHLGETPDECGNAIHAEFDKRDAEIERLRAQVSEARGLLAEFELTIDNACDGDHPCAAEVRAWLEENK